MWPPVSVWLLPRLNPRCSTIRLAAAAVAPPRSFSFSLSVRHVGPVYADLCDVQPP